MSTVASIEEQIDALSAEELAQLRAWFLVPSRRLSGGLSVRSNRRI